MNDTQWAVEATAAARNLSGITWLTVKVEECGADGLCGIAPDGWTVIHVRPGLPEPARTWVLAHEAAHAKLHRDVMAALPAMNSGHYTNSAIEQEADAQADKWFSEAKTMVGEYFAHKGVQHPPEEDWVRLILICLTYFSH